MYVCIYICVNTCNYMYIYIYTSRNMFIFTTQNIKKKSWLVNIYDWLMFFFIGHMFIVQKAQNYVHYSLANFMSLPYI